MYRLFHRLEPVLFGLVTASAVACAGILIAHQYGGLPALDLVLPQVAEAAAVLMPYGERPGDVVTVGQPPPTRIETK